VHDLVGSPVSLTLERIVDIADGELSLDDSDRARR
jgi:hypothetical protein